MKRGLVSVVMPVKNGANYLAHSIKSILSQDYARREVIIVDGQSTDDTRIIAESFAEVRYLYQKTNPGIAHAKNLGAAAARGEFLAFISHDDLWSPHKLRRQVEYFREHPDVEYTITRVNFFLEPGCECPASFNPALFEGDHVGTMPETLMVRKSYFDASGGFVTDYGFMEDIEWFHRARLNQVPMAVIQEVLLFKRIHSTNTSYEKLHVGTINREIFAVLRGRLRASSR